MPRYIVERTIPKLSPAELQRIGKKVVEVADYPARGSRGLRATSRSRQGKATANLRRRTLKCFANTLRRLDSP